MKYWQIIADNLSKVALAIFALSASVAVAENFKTINGKEYKNARVSRVEPDGIVLKTKSGISKVYFVELPKDVQERFHYDAPKAVSSAAPQLKVAYVEYLDEMGRITAKTANLVSSNTVRFFGFPYEGEIHAWLTLQNSPKPGQDIMLRVERGQFVSSYTKDFATVRFDDGEWQMFTIGDPEGGTSDHRFIHDNGTFINQLRQAKSLKIKADFYEEGSRVFEFDVRGLDW